MPKRLSLIALSLLTLAACKPIGMSSDQGTNVSSAAEGRASSSAPTVFHFEPVVETTAGPDDILKSKAYLQISGSTNARILIGEQEAIDALEVQYVNPLLHEGTTVLAAFEQYYAGGGFQVVLRRTGDTVIVQKRFTSEGSADEQGGCGTWTELASFTAQASTEVEVSVSITGLPQETLVIGCPWE